MVCYNAASMGPQTITEIKQLTEELLQKAELTGDVTVEVGESAVVQVFIKLPEEESGADERGLLIGRRGETLRSLQLLLSLMVNNDKEEWIQLTVDVDDYRQRREEQLIATANRIAEKVSYLKEPIALSPMSAMDRRVIHMALAENSAVVSESSGEGRDRKVVVSPA